MPLFGHHNQAPGGMRENEQVIGKWRTHHGELELTNQRCLLVKSAGGAMGMVEGKHEIAWGVDLEAIQDIQIVAGTNQAAQGATNAAAPNAPAGGLGGALGSMGLGSSHHLIINGQSFPFHEASHANAALAQIQSARDVRMKQIGQS